MTPYRHKSKQLDLSLAFRLTGLASGAKLELVQLSRSPSVVTVALQLPPSEAGGLPNGRMLDKFPSTTTFWHLLRKFESGVAGGGSTRNLTARGVPATDNGSTGAGRLFYETPVVQAMGRELSTFTDLQNSLAQMGFNNGNVLLRLSFRRTEEPLEVAMVKIQDYFKTIEDVEEAEKPTQKETAAPQPTGESQPQPTASDNAEAPPVSEEQPLSQATPAEPLAAAAVPATEASTAEAPTAPAFESTESRPVTVFSPPSSSTPQSAQVTYNDNDYLPTVEHAQAHQRRLNAASRPTRLPTDAEIAAKAAAEEERLSSIQEVDVKVRLPDQSQVVAKFSQHDTGHSLYNFVRNCLTEPFAHEKFILALFPITGTPGPKKPQNTVPDSDRSLLIKDLGMVGRVLVSFTWDASVSPSTAQKSKSNLLRPELRSQAQQLKVDQPADVAGNTAVASSSGQSQQSQDKPARKPGSLPKWLKLPGKK